MRIVIALGGNALLRRGEPMTTEAQRRNIRIAAGAIAPLPSPTRWTCWTRAPGA
jgi:carbamate kinase